MHLLTIRKYVKVNVPPFYSYLFSFSFSLTRRPPKNGWSLIIEYTEKKEREKARKDLDEQQAKKLVRCMRTCIYTCIHIKIEYICFILLLSSLHDLEDRKKKRK